MSIQSGRQRVKAWIVKKRDNGFLLVKTANGFRIVHRSELLKR